MSDTPRTDKWVTTEPDGGQAVPFFIAAQFERQNAELRKLLKTMLEKPQCEIWRFKQEIEAALEYAQGIAKSPRDSAYTAFCMGYSQLERENAELKNEIMKLRSIVLTIQVLEYDSHKLKGHECFAKHWALSLLDRVKRLKKGKANE